MRPNFPSHMAHRFAASCRRYWELLGIFVSSRPDIDQKSSTRVIGKASVGPGDCLPF
jgi:hypothetical protein